MVLKLTDNETKEEQKFPVMQRPIGTQLSNSNSIVWYSKGQEFFITTDIFFPMSQTIINF
jgi:hypothetical protein